MLGIQHYDQDNKPICHICGKSFHRLLAHVRQCHGINSKLYRNMYGFCKSFSFISKESKEKSRDKVFENIKCIKDNLIEKGKETRFFNNHKKCVHVMTPQRIIKLNENKLKIKLKPKAFCVICSKELSSRKGNFCLKHYRIEMIKRNKKDKQ